MTPVCKKGEAEMFYPKRLERVYFTCKSQVSELSQGLQNHFQTPVILPLCRNSGCERPNWARSSSKCFTYKNSSNLHKDMGRCALPSFHQCKLPTVDQTAGLGFKSVASGWYSQTIPFIASHFTWFLSSKAVGSVCKCFRSHATSPC